MAFSHGSKAKVYLDNGAGTLTDITAYVSSASLELVRDTAETTTLGLGTKTYVAGLRDATVSLEGRYDPAIDQLLADDLGDSTNTKTLQYDPQGTGAGLPRYTVETWVTRYSIETGVDDVAAISAELQCTGAVTRSTQ